jgi:hypothetical protein
MVLVFMTLLVRNTRHYTTLHYTLLYYSTPYYTTLPMIIFFMYIDFFVSSIKSAIYIYIYFAGYGLVMWSPKFLKCYHSSLLFQYNSVHHLYKLFFLLQELDVTIIHTN